MSDRLLLPVAAIESETRVREAENDGVKLDVIRINVRLKGQRPDDEFLLKFYVSPDAVKNIHNAKKRGGEVFVSLQPGDGALKDGEIVVRDILE